MDHLASVGVVKLSAGTAAGDPTVEISSSGKGEGRAFELLQKVVSDLQSQNGAPPLSGLKNELRKRDKRFSEKNYGYGGFLQFVKAATAKGLVDMRWDDEAEDYLVSAAG
jgi:hypothetical protein